MAAGSVYSLEAELSDLEECAREICSSTSNMELSFLEEQVAAAAARVQQSELQVDRLISSHIKLHRRGARPTTCTCAKSASFYFRQNESAVHVNKD